MVLLIAAAGAVILFFVVQYSNDLRAATLLPGGTPWYNIPIVRGLLLFGLLLVVPPVLVSYGPRAAVLHDERWWWVFAGFLSLCISYTWYRYLTWLDVFEPERRRTMLFVFVLGGVLPLLVMKPLHHVLVAATGLEVNGRLGNDLLFTTVVVGMAEELVKLVPYLLVLRFTKQVNEPYDHLLYASMGALGFACVENTMYLQGSELAAVGGRALFAAVAHMCFTSAVAYGIARTQQRGFRYSAFTAVGLFLVASLAHGLYDVWLVAPGRPAFLTFVFFLGTVQVWGIMKNNLVNLSPFIQPQHRLRSTMFRYRIVNAMLAIGMGAFVAVDLMRGEPAAWGLLRMQGPGMLVVLLIVALNCGDLYVVPGYVARIGLPANPVRWFLPVPRFGTDLSGSRIRVDIPTRSWRTIDLPALRRGLPVMGLLERRVVVDGDADWYLFRPERQLDLGHGFEPLFLMKLDAAVDTIPSNYYVRMMLRRFTGEPLLAGGVVTGPTELFGPRFFAQLVPPILTTGGGDSGLSAMGGYGLS